MNYHILSISTSINYQKRKCGLTLRGATHNTEVGEARDPSEEARSTTVPAEE
jgi:hypothetical protein